MWPQQNPQRAAQPVLSPAPERRATGKRWHWGIAQLLILLVLASLAPFVLLDLYHGTQDVARSRDSVTSLATTTAQEEAKTMNDYLRLSDRSLSTLAADPIVRSLNPYEVSALFQTVQQQNPTYENLYLLGLDGAPIASLTPMPSDTTFSQAPYVQQVLKTGRLVISSAIAWQGTAHSVVVLAEPVRSKPGSSPIAVLSVTVNIARLSDAIGYVSLPPNSVILLAQENGLIIAAADHPESWVGHSLAGRRVLRSAQAAQSGATSGTLGDGVARVVGFQSLQTVPWVMLAGLPQSEVNAVLRQGIERTVQQAAIAIVAAALLAWIVLRRVVLPIRTLSEGAQAFAAGQLDRRIPLQRRDELGDLADALNTMAFALEQRLQEEAAHAQALRDLNRLQTEFVATASHELRTPVTAIRTYAEALLRPDISDESTRRECVQGIDRASDRLARLVRTLLDVSRIDSGNVSVRLSPVDPIAITQSAIAQVVSVARDPVALETAAEPPSVLADPDRLEDVLANLISNACKFSPPAAPVTVAIQPRDDQVVISVHDRGTGIAEPELTRVFDRFYQIQRGAGRSQGGSGLGLYIARGYVVAMGGRIWAESSVGEGSTFSVALPVVRPIAGTAEVKDAADSVAAGR